MFPVRHILKSNLKRIMKNKLTLWTLMLPAVSAFSQSTEMRTVPSFHKIEIKSRATIYLRQDSVQSVKVSSDGSLDQVETRVKDNTMVVDGKGHGELVVDVHRL